MVRLLTGIIALLLTFAAATDAQGQDNNRIGLMVETPTLIGFTWELSERIALRPEFSLSTTTQTFGDPSVSIVEIRSHSYNGTVAVSGVFYIRRWDSLRLYVSPRVSHLISRTSGTTTQTAVSGSLGGQYDVSGRFAIFAEAGINLSRTRSSAAQRTSTLGNRGVIGAVIFF
jgi:hypothetical protein